MANWLEAISRDVPNSGWSGGDIRRRQHCCHRRSRRQSQHGAGWVFTRSNGVWTQQGDKLVGMDPPSPPFQCCPAISGNGNTILFTGLQPNSGNGFPGVFTRENGYWTQQGGVLIGSDVGGSLYQSGSSALSRDGNTAIVSGYDKISSAAYAWIFARRDGVWSQQGDQLEGAEPLAPPNPTPFVALSADGRTALVNNAIFVRDRRGPWRKIGSIAAPAGPAAFSADGTTIIIGEPGITMDWERRTSLSNRAVRKK